MKRGVKFAVSMMTVAMFMTGCSSSSSGKTDDSVLKIGINIEETGDYAQYGTAILQGAKLAVEKANANKTLGDVTIEAIDYDNKSTADEATQVQTRLIDEGVSVIVGPAVSGLFKSAVGSVDSDVATISASGTSTDLTLESDGKTVVPNAYRVCFTDEYQGIIMAEYAKETLAAKSALIFYDNSSDYGVGLANNFEDKFKELGGVITDQVSFTSGQTDFQSVLTSLKDKDFDVLYIPGYYNQVGLIIKQARALGIEQPILGADGFESDTLVELAGASALNNVYYTNHYSTLIENDELADFISSYTDEYGKTPNAFSALGYDAANLAIDAAKRADSTDPAAINKAISETKDFAGVTGTISIDENHNAIKSVVLISLKDGKADKAVFVGD